MTRKKRSVENDPYRKYRDLLLDQLVGKGGELRRHLDAERPRGLQVDDELEPDRLLDRQVGWLGALEDAASIDADLTMLVRRCRFRSSSVRRLDKLALPISRWNPDRSPPNWPIARGGYRRIRRHDEEGIGALARNGGKGRIDLSGSCWR